MVSTNRNDNTGSATTAAILSMLGGGIGSNIKKDLNLNGHLIHNVGDGVASGDVTNLGQVQ